MRNSKQREAIRKALAATDSHPSADELYNVLRASMPNISLGTVYRNLNLLVESGEAARIPDPDGQGARYDSVLEGHAHLVCTACGSMTDLDLDILGDIDAQVLKATGFYVTSHTIVLRGTCAACLSNETKTC